MLSHPLVHNTISNSMKMAIPEEIKNRNTGSACCHR